MRAALLAAAGVLFQHRFVSGIENEGPYKPGDSRYWVNLNGLIPTEGELKPAFNPLVTDYELRISNWQVRLVTFTLALKFDKYEAFGMPALLLDNQKMNYSAMDVIQQKVVLDDSPAPFDRTVTLTIADPAGSRGFGQTAKHTDYHIHILQPANYTTAVNLDFVEVRSGGKVIAASHIGAKFMDFDIPPQEKAVEVNYRCNPLSTTSTFNGDEFDCGGMNCSKVVQMDAYQETVDVSCRYQEKVFGSRREEHMSTLRLHQSVNLTVAALKLDFRLLPRFGYCTNVRSLEDPSYKCYTNVKDPEFVIMYSDRRAVVSMAVPDIHRLQLGIPRHVVMTNDKEQWDILVQGGVRELRVPVQVTLASDCSTMQCPAHMVSKTWASGDENLQARLCTGKPCPPEDAQRCCRGRPPCSTAAGICEKNKLLLRGNADSLQCARGTCEDADRDTCCTNKYAAAQEKVYNTIDTNGDGKFQKEEVLAAVKRWGITDSGPAQKWIAEADTDKNGVVERSEFDKIIKAHSLAGFMSLFDKPDDHVMDIVRDKVHGVLDTDGNGRIDTIELVAAGSRRNETATPKEIKEMIDEVDANKNGVVDLIELSHAVWSQTPSKLQTWLVAHVDDEWLVTLQQRMSGELEKVRIQVAAKAKIHVDAGCTPEPTMNPAGEPIWFDPTCTENPPAYGGMGCWAGGLNANCRYCGFKDFPPCPNGMLNVCFAGTCSDWDRNAKAWCKGAYGITCDYYSGLTYGDWAMLRNGYTNDVSSVGYNLRLFDDESEVITDRVRTGSGGVIWLGLVAAATLAVVGVFHRASALKGHRILTMEENEVCLEESRE